MPAIDHWHPILLSRALREEPVGVTLDGKGLVLFRTKSGQIGALDECCPHRRMRLSRGKVVGERLRCAYHGWTFTHQGAGESPGTPKLHATTGRYEVCESRGTVWVKAWGSRAAFPEFHDDSFYHLCTLYHKVRAPLELTLDNFTEIEHTATTHAVFGYDLERMNEVDVRFETTPSSVRVINLGPQRRMSPVFRLLLGIRRHDYFNDDWTTYFSPVYSIYNHWWSDVSGRREGKVRFRLAIFFIPLSAGETGLMTFAYIKSAYPGPQGGVRLFKPLLIHLLDREIRLDVAMLEGLADMNPGVEGMKLSRFDRVLGLNRERIDRIYRGRRAAA